MMILSVLGDDVTDRRSINKQTAKSGNVAHIMTATIDECLYRSLNSMMVFHVAKDDLVFLDFAKLSKQQESKS